MSVPWWKTVCVLVAWGAFGLLRLPFESRLSQELAEQGLVPAKLNVNTKDKIGQTSSAVALGGLRTLVATFLNLRAFTFFTEQKWDDVEETFEWIVDLAPKTRYYWETGSWHQAYNESAYYLNHDELPPLRRREAWRAAVISGKNFLVRAVENNPGDWRLWANLGFLLADPNKFHAFPDQDETFRQSAESYRKAHESGNAPDYVRRSQLHALVRVQGAEAEALKLARVIRDDPGQQLPPTTQCVLYVLESWNDPEGSPLERAVKVFGTERRAYDHLGSFWMRTYERYPMHGVAAALEALEKRLGVAKEKSILNQTPLQRDPAMWFGNQ